MIGHAFEIADDVHEYESQFDCAFSRAQTIDMTRFQFLRQIIHNLLKRLNALCAFDILL